MQLTDEQQSSFGNNPGDFTEMVFQIFQMFQHETAEDEIEKAAGIERPRIGGDVHIGKGDGC